MLTKLFLLLIRNRFFQPVNLSICQHFNIFYISAFQDFKISTFQHFNLEEDNSNPHSHSVGERAGTITLGWICIGVERDGVDPVTAILSLSNVRHWRDLWNCMKASRQVGSKLVNKAYLLRARPQPLKQCRQLL